VTEDVTFSYGQQQRALTLNTGTDPTESTAITSSPAASVTEDVTFSYGQQQRALTLNTGTDPTESTAITS
ncbi:hypothetical protein CEF09_19135, partial [Vibrio cholerae]